MMCPPYVIGKWKKPKADKTESSIITISKFSFLTKEVCNKVEADATDKTKKSLFFKFE